MKTEATELVRIAKTLTSADPYDEAAEHLRDKTQFDAIEDASKDLMRVWERRVDMLQGDKRSGAGVTNSGTYLEQVLSAADKLKEVVNAWIIEGDRIQRNMR